MSKMYFWQTLKKIIAYNSIHLATRNQLLIKNKDFINLISKIPLGTNYL